MSKSSDDRPQVTIYDSLPIPMTLESARRLQQWAEADRVKHPQQSTWWSNLTTKKPPQPR